MANPDQNVRKRIRQRRRDIATHNREHLSRCGLPYTDKGHTLLFRGDRPADFYPATGRWKDVTTGKVHTGGAKHFLRWLREVSP